MTVPHFLIVVAPGQGHINPALQLSKLLLRHGAHVTFSTTIFAHRRMIVSEMPPGLSFANYSDGRDDHGYQPGDDMELYMSELERRGSETLRELILLNAEKGSRITHIFYTLIWACDVARSLQVPATVFWIQPATMFGIYYYFANGYQDVIRNLVNEHPLDPLRLPGLPPLFTHDIPSFFNAEVKSFFILRQMHQFWDILKEESNPKVLINTFDALETEALKAMDKLTFVTIGPLLPSAYLDRDDPAETSYGGDIFQSSRDYIEWLNSKPKASVIYIAFGSIFSPNKQQMEELARGLIHSGRPFLWVIRGIDKEENKLSCKEELEKQGMIVPWCSQVEVLSHPSVGCFVSHCGWNSTFESMTCGVPLVALPQFGDQLMNSKLVEEEWKTGVRRAKMNENGIVEGDEIRKCLELVVGGGEKSEEIRRNVRKWRELAREAGKKGGSSENNLKAFLDEIEESLSSH